MVDTRNNIEKNISNDFARHFAFLEKELDMSVVEQIPMDKGTGNFVCIFKNKFVQLELAGDNNYFYVVIRRLINGKPQSYSDHANNITSEDLAIFITNNDYNHFDYYVPSAGWENVLNSTAKLLIEAKEFLTGKWVDTNIIKQLKERDFENKFGFHPNSKPDFFSLIKEGVQNLLNKKGYALIFDSSTLAPYDKRNLLNQITFEKKDTQFKIFQKDWRDFPNDYVVEKNGRVELELNLSNIPENEVLGKVVSLIDNLSK